MGDISDQEIRRRLSVFNTVVPPVTNSTRGLLLNKLEELETSQSNQFDSPKKNELSSLNVSNWNNSGSDDDDDRKLYLLSGRHYVRLNKLTFYIKKKKILFHYKPAHLNSFIITLQTLKRFLTNYYPK